MSQGQRNARAKTIESYFFRKNKEESKQNIDKLLINAKTGPSVESVQDTLDANLIWQVELINYHKKNGFLIEGCF